MTFDDFGFSPDILEAVRAKGYVTPSPIQEKAIPYLLANDGNLLGKAQTGTGKTAAFGLPMLERLQPGSDSVQAIVLAPTRELAMQVAEELNSLRGKKKLRITTVYGGQSIGKQLSALERGVDIVVGTPGRIKDHLNRGSLNLSNLSYFVLDEADEMLNMGFLEEIEEILERTNDDKQMLLFSATMPKKILRLVPDYMKKYELIEVESAQQTTDLTEQVYYQVRESERFESLCRIIDSSVEFFGTVFTNTKREADEIAMKLTEKGTDSEALHGDIQQSQRESILKKLKKRKVSVLVATDVAARGIDVSDLTHVVNYSIPQDPESYVHRIGRTGRAGKKGIAVSLVSRSEISDLRFIEKVAQTKLTKKTIPSVEDVLNVKKSIIHNKIQNIIEHSGYMDYIGVAQDILMDNDPEIALAAILKQAFKDQLKSDSYYNFAPEEAVAPGRSFESKGPRDFSRPSYGGGNKSSQRIFIARGRADGESARSIVDFIVKETNLSAKQINDVHIS